MWEVGHPVVALSCLSLLGCQLLFSLLFLPWEVLGLLLCSRLAACLKNHTKNPFFQEACDLMLTVPHCPPPVLASLLVLTVPSRLSPVLTSLLHRNGGPVASSWARGLQSSMLLALLE